ncbi:MAG: DUF4157 domain-containing protein [Caldilineaceae bacterium]|nr:DUF4157 domain-containing protein [Caldilineaceae bacterium]
MRNQTLPAPSVSLHLQQRSNEQIAKETSGAHAAIQRDPTAQLACRLGDASCTGAHAERVSPAPVQRAPAPGAVLRLQRHYGNRFVQRVVHLARQGDGEADVAPEIERSIQAARGGGQSLDRGVRAQMEPALGANFGGVRVHHNAQADRLNQSLSARAFTTGQDIFFKQGEYNPGSSGGRELLAHELTHVVQQNGDQVQTKLTVGAPGDRFEQEADSTARAVMEQETQAQRQTPSAGSSSSSMGSMPPKEEEEEQQQQQGLPLRAKSDSLMRIPPSSSSSSSASSGAPPPATELEDEEDEPLAMKREKAGHDPKSTHG